MAGVTSMLQTGMCPFNLETCRKCEDRYQCQYFWFTFEKFKSFASVNNRWKTNPIDSIKNWMFRCSKNELPCNLIDKLGNIRTKQVVDAFKRGELWPNQHT